MANELADFDEQLDEIISSHQVKKSKEKRILRKKELKTQNIEKISSLKYEKLIRKSNQTLALQILGLFHEESYCDLIIECNQFFKYLHSCIFIARVPALFELLKERFIVGNDPASLVPVFGRPTTLANPLYDNNLETNSNSLNGRVEEQQQPYPDKEIRPRFVHIRLPAELLQIFDLVGFLQGIYSEEPRIESLELELILVLNKIKVLQDQELFTLENYLALDSSCRGPMNESPLGEAKQDGCERMQVKQERDEPLYINLEEERSLKNSNDRNAQNSADRPNDDGLPKCDSLKKDKTFLLSKIGLESGQFEINLLNDNEASREEMVDQLANIDHEINEMKNQIDTAAVMDRLSIDPENEEQQLITALSNEKIEINALLNDDDDDEQMLYGNIKRDGADTVSDVSEICDEFSVHSDSTAKCQDDLPMRSLKIGDIQLNFDKQDAVDEPCLDKRSSLFYELINIKNKVQKAVGIEKAPAQKTEKSLLTESKAVYSSYENENDMEEERTLSGSMVRSGTFNLQCQTPINTIIESKLNSAKSGRLTESEDDSSLSRKIEQDSLMSNPNDGKTKPAKTSKSATQANRVDRKAEKKAQLPNQKKGLQYFLNEDQIVAKQHEIDEMERSLTSATRQSSGLFFIDLDDPQLVNNAPKSNTFDRKKNRFHQKGTSESNGSSLNSSFIDDRRLPDNLCKINQDCDLLPMSIIAKKESCNEKSCRSSAESGGHNDGMFRLGSSQFKTLSGTSITSSSRTSKSASTLRNNLKKTKSEITNHTLQQQAQQKEEEENEIVTRKSVLSCSQLGLDLLKLFVNQINCDFSLLVADKSQHLGAHRCILMARSEFFAKRFSGNPQCNQINLIDFSYDSVHFVISHIYCGTIDIPNFSSEERAKCLPGGGDLNSLIHKEYQTELNLAELLSLSELFQLSVLKDVILFEIKRNYCHNYHTPCDGCISGVINCLSLAQKCEIPSLYNCCCSWIARHYKRIWSTKQFATLFTQPGAEPQSNPKARIHRQPVSKNNDVINYIYSAILDSLTNDSVIDKILSLQQLGSMPRMKWNEMIISLIEELIEDCCKYVAANYDQIVSRSSFIQLGFDKSWQLDILENYLLLAVDSMKCETALQTFLKLENLILMCDLPSENGSRAANRNERNDNPIYANTPKNHQFSDEFVRTVQKLYKSCERFLIHNANEAVYCDSWNQLSPSTRDYIKNSAVLVFEFEKPLAKRPVLSSSMMSSRQSAADKATSSAKRKSGKSKRPSEEKSSDQSRQNTLTRHSARSAESQKKAVAPECAESAKSEERPTKKENNSLTNQENYEDSQHIYDEPPQDLVHELIKEKKECLVEYAKPNKKTPQSGLQVAKVQPFSVLPAELSISNLTTSLISSNYENYEELIENNYENIIYDESISLQKVGSESSLASSTLQEADMLEQELIKVQNQRLDALRQSKLQSNCKQQNASIISANIGSPQLRTSLRCRNRQQSANPVNPNSANPNSNRNDRSDRNAKSRSAYKLRPPFK